MNPTSVKKYLRLLLVLLSSAMTLSAHADVYSSIKTYSRAMMAFDALYVDTVNLDKLNEVAIKAVLKELDPHSTYLDAEEVAAMQENLGGNFEGIGVRYQMENDTLLVINTVTGGPSEKAGIMAGDRIIMVGDSTIAGMKYPTKEIQRRLRGPRGSKVNIGVQRSGEKKLLWFTLTRDNIPVYSIDASYMAAPGVGYIKLSRFAQTTADEVEKAIEDFKKEGLKDLIIDLQDNGGGYLNAAVELAELFLLDGELVVYTDGRTEGRRNYVTRRGRNAFRGRLIVIMDEQSASASEIFAGCMQDVDRGVIVGRRSFGKGLVQRPIDLPNGGMIRLTVAHYYTPSGRDIQKPYTKGDQKNYQHDLLNRLRNGELTSADSIHLPDSLLFHTRGGRPVYGGGGIMPDVFVPLDTTKLSEAHRAVIAKGSLNTFTLNYFKSHQAKLKKKMPTLDDFISQKFEVSDEMVQGLIEQARKDSVKSDSLETLMTNDIFRMHLKAYLANDLYENGAFTRVMNQTNEAFLKALGIFAEENKYRNILEGKKDE